MTLKHPMEKLRNSASETAEIYSEINRKIVMVHVSDGGKNHRKKMLAFSPPPLDLISNGNPMTSVTSGPSDEFKKSTSVDPSVQNINLCSILKKNRRNLSNSEEGYSSSRDQSLERNGNLRESPNSSNSSFELGHNNTKIFTLDKVDFDKDFTDNLNGSDSKNGGGKGQRSSRADVNGKKCKKEILNSVVFEEKENDETPLLSPVHQIVGDDTLGELDDAKRAKIGGKKEGPKRVSFGSSKGSMVETLIYDNSRGSIGEIVDSTPEKKKTGSSAVLDAIKAIENRNSSNSNSPCITYSKYKPTTADNSNPTNTNADDDEESGGSRPASRVRVTFFESEKPLAVSSPENSDILEFDFSTTNNMTLPGSPNNTAPPQHSPNSYIRSEHQIGGWDNPFRPDGDLSKEADQIVELIKEGKPINEENLMRSKSPVDNMTMIINGSAANGGNVEIQHGLASPSGGGVEHVVIKKKKGCCVIQ